MSFDILMHFHLRISRWLCFSSVLINFEYHIISMIFRWIEVDSGCYNLYRCIKFIRLIFIGIICVKIGIGDEIIIIFIELHVIGYSLMKIWWGLPSMMIFLNIFTIFIKMFVSWKIWSLLTSTLPLIIYFIILMWNYSRCFLW